MYTWLIFKHWGRLWFRLIMLLAQLLTANVTSQTYAICNEIDISNRKKKHLIAWIFFKKVIEKDVTSRGERGTKRIVHRSLKIRRTVLRFVMLTETFFRCSLHLTLRILFFLQSSQFYFIFWVLLSRGTIKIDNGNEVGLAVGVFPLCVRFPP